MSNDTSRYEGTEWEEGELTKAYDCSRSRAVPVSQETLESGRDVYQQGYLAQRRGSFRSPCPYPLGSWQAKAWNQGYDHAKHNETFGLGHPSFANK